MIKVLSLTEQRLVSGGVCGCTTVLDWLFSGLGKCLGWGKKEPVYIPFNGGIGSGNEVSYGADDDWKDLEKDTR